MIQQDARNNEHYGSIDGVNGTVITETRTITNTLSSNGATVAIDLNGKTCACFDVRTAAGSLTFIFEGTNNGTDFFQLPAWQLSSESIVMGTVVTTTHAQQYMVSCTGFKRVQLRITAFTSGNIAVAARASVSDFAIYARPAPSNLNQSIAPAANTGGTITLPAAGAGLFHYITGFQLTAALNPATAQTGAAPVFVTTTNIPNTPAWAVPIVGNAAASTGGFGAAFGYLIDARWGNPLKSTVANTNTTFVIPALGAAVTLRANVQYYVGA